MTTPLSDEQLAELASNARQNDGRVAKWLDLDRSLALIEEVQASRTQLAALTTERDRLKAELEEARKVQPWRALHNFRSRCRLDASSCDIGPRHPPIQTCVEVRRCRVGDVVVALMRDGTLRIHGNKLIGQEFTDITREMLQDMLVALDVIQAEQPVNQEPNELRVAVIEGAHALAREIYKRTAYRAIIDVGVHPDVFYRIALEDDGRMGRRDYESGRMRVGPDVEISVARELLK